MFEECAGATPNELQTNVQWGSVRCAAAGCIRDATYENIEVAMKLGELMSSREGDSPLRDWQGRVARSPPVELAGGRVVTTWALMKPESSGIPGRK